MVVEKKKYMALAQGPELLLTAAEKLTCREPIGQGGYGLVYKANHSEWGTVAFKVLQDQFLNE